MRLSVPQAGRERMLRGRDIDWILIASTMLLVVTGIVMVYSTSYVYALTRFGDGGVFFRKQIIWAAIGLCLFIVGAQTPYEWYRKLAYPAFILAVLALVAISIPGMGVSAGVAKRWVRLGPMTFQPSEAAKIAIVILMAYRLAAKEDRIKDYASGFFPNMVIFVGILCFLIMREPDLGSALFVVFIASVMCLAAGARIRHFAVTAVVAAPLIYLFVVLKYSYMIGRLAAYFDSLGNAANKGYQLKQSFIAFGSGGITGVGLGAGKQKLLFLPEAHTDFIFSVIGEEFGLVGVGVIIALYLAILFCGVQISLNAKDSHGRYLALGLTVMIVAQAAANMGVVLDLLPQKGLPLPFLSYGGSSLAVSMLAAGMLLNIWIRSNNAWGGANIWTHLRRG